MFFFYQLINYILIFISPVIILVRILRKKEHIFRFLEKFTVFTKKNTHGNIIWFHGASVGEIMSIIPLIEKYEKRKDISKILVTSQTLSSSLILKKFNFKKTVHQFYPLDINLFSKRFLNYWNPKIAIFIDSEIWPAMFFQIKRKSIPLILLNARITNKSFKNWSKFIFFAKKIFQKIDMAYPQNYETYKYLKKLGPKKIKFIGNIKFAESESEKKINLASRLLKKMQKRKVWCASSTHETEEIICGKTHIKVRKKIKNLLTIIIPRHIHRVPKILEDLKNLGLNVCCHDSKKNISKSTDIYLVNTYGETKKFYKISETVLLGGSFINRGGQNPIEPARYGNKIIHGPHIKNFREVYSYLSKHKISSQVNDYQKLQKKLSILLKRKKLKNTSSKKLKIIGHKILYEYLNNINKILKYEL